MLRNVPYTVLESQSRLTCEDNSPTDRPYSFSKILRKFVCSREFVNTSTFFISLRRMMSAVASISSEKVNEGMVSASVMVLVMAFFMPVIFFTLRGMKAKS